MIKFREKSYSLITKYDLADILVPRVISSVAGGILSRNWSSALEGFFVNSAADVMTFLFRNKVYEFKNRMMSDLTNEYLINSLNKLGFREGRDYNVKNKGSKISVNLNNGILMICMNKGYNNELVNYLKSLNSQITDMGNYTFISYQAIGKNNLDKVLKGLMKYAKKIDIYDNR